MKYYIIAGEASGDLHASNLVTEIGKLDPSAEFRGWGGDLMQARGVELVKHFREVAFMGFAEVARNLGTIMKAMGDCKRDILRYKPDALVLIDYPGFNLRIAEFGKRHHIPVIYYISPQIWAWKKSRVQKIRKYVDKMMVILPFEKEFYASNGYEVTFVGHPLLDVTGLPSTYPDQSTFAEKNRLTGKPIIALLPGSRKQEISTMLPVMASLQDRYIDYEFVVAGAPSQEPQYYRDLLKDKEISVLFGETYEILRHARAALVTSGTATLETALFEVPEVVCYKGSTISYLIARRLVNVKYISLVNLVMDREVVKELIQGDFNRHKLTEALDAILEPSNALRLKEEYRQLKTKLGDSGASARAADEIVSYLNRC